MITKKYVCDAVCSRQKCGIQIGMRKKQQARNHATGNCYLKKTNTILNCRNYVQYRCPSTPDAQSFADQREVDFSSPKVNRFLQRNSMNAINSLATP